MGDFSDLLEEYSNRCMVVEDAECTAETDAACLVRACEEEVWIPKSQIDDDSEVYQMGTSGYLVIRTWFCKRKGWV